MTHDTTEERPAAKEERREETAPWDDIVEEAGAEVELEAAAVLDAMEDIILLEAIDIEDIMLDADSVDEAAPVEEAAEAAALGVTPTAKHYA